MNLLVAPTMTQLEMARASQSCASYVQDIVFIITLKGGTKALTCKGFSRFKPTSGAQQPRTQN